MQEVLKAVETLTEQCGGSEEKDMVEGPAGAFLVAAHKWSHTSLEVFDGKLLQKALLLAAAMSEFAHELQHPS